MSAEAGMSEAKTRANNRHNEHKNPKFWIFAKNLFFHPKMDVEKHEITFKVGHWSPQGSLKNRHNEHTENPFEYNRLQTLPNYHGNSCGVLWMSKTDTVRCRFARTLTNSRHKRTNR